MALAKGERVLSVDVTDRHMAGSCYIVIMDHDNRTWEDMRQ